LVDENGDEVQNTVIIFLNLSLPFNNSKKSSSTSILSHLSFQHQHLGLGLKESNPAKKKI